MPEETKEFEVVVYAVVCCRFTGIKSKTEKHAIETADGRFASICEDLFNWNAPYNKNLSMEQVQRVGLKHTEMYEEYPALMYLVDEVTGRDSDGEPILEGSWYGPDGETRLPGNFQELNDPFGEWERAKELWKQKKIIRETTRMAPPLKIEQEEDLETCTGVGRRKHQDSGNSHD